MRIFGTDNSGQIFSERALTVNVSRNGAELAGVRSPLKIDEMIGLSYGANRVHFRVRWIGEPATPRANHVGLLNLSPEKPLWDFLPPPNAEDNFELKRHERRTAPRFRCQNSVEVYLDGGASFWGTLADLSLGGCYLEMPIPLPPGTKLNLAIWFGQTKALVNAEVAHITPGMGIGLKFDRVSTPDREQIKRFVETLAPFTRKMTRLASVVPSRF